MKQILLRKDSTLGSSTTYINLEPGNAGAGFQGSHEVVWPVSGVFRNLTVTLLTAPGTSQNRTFTLLIDNVATALTVAFGAATTQAQDTAHTVSITAGQRVVLQATTASGAPATTAIRWTLEFDSSDNYSSAYATNVSIAKSGFVDVFTGSISATAADCERRIPCDGVITEMWMANYFSAIGGTNILNAYIYKNGVKQDGTGGTVDTKTILASVAVNVPVTKTFVLSVSRGDTVYIGLEEGGTYPASWTSIGIRFEATTMYESIVAMGPSGDPSNSVAHYCALIQNRSTGIWLSANNSSSQLEAGITPFTLKDLIVDSVAPGGSATRTFELLKNGSAPSGTPTVAIIGASTSGLDNGSVGFVQNDIVGPMRHTPTSTPTITPRETWALVMTSDPPLPPDPPGGGGGLVGVNPPQGIVPSVAPEVFVVFTLDGVDYPFGVGQLNDDPTWFGGKKKGRIKDISSIKYQLTKEGGHQAVSFTVTLFDGDRVFHDMAGTTAKISGGYCSVYVIDHADRIAENVPKRLGAGYITKYSASDDFTFTFTVKDALSVRLAKIDKEPNLPPGRFILTDFPGMDPAMNGRAIPLVVGKMSDDTELIQQGEVPPVYLGQVNLQDLNGLGINQLTDAYIWTQGAVVNNGIVSVWYNTPTTPLVRLLSPSSAFGVIAWTPFWPGWTAGTGIPENYVDYNGRRYTPLYIKADIPEAALIRQGNILLAANIYGTEDVGDTTGQMIDSPAHIVPFILVNYVFTRYLTGAYASIPEYAPETTAPYSWIDTTTFDDVHDYFVARVGGVGYTCGLILGANGEAITASDFLQQMCAGVWMDIGINLEGQLIASVYDPTSTPLDTFDAISDIEKNTYTVSLNEQRNVNRVEYQFGRYYVPPYAPAPTPAEGDPVPSAPIPDYPEYRSGLQVVEDTIAQANIGEIVTYVHQNEVVRDSSIALDVALRIMEEGRGPTGFGPHEFSLRGGWQLLTNTQLGKNIYVKHPAVLGSVGLDLCRVTTIDIYPLQHRVVLGGDVIDHNVVTGPPE